MFLAFDSSIYYRLFQYLSSLTPVSIEGDGRYYYTPLQAILKGEWQILPVSVVSERTNS